MRLYAPGGQLNIGYKIDGLNNDTISCLEMRYRTGSSQCQVPEEEGNAEFRFPVFVSAKPTLCVFFFVFFSGLDSDSGSCFLVVGILVYPWYRTTQNSAIVCSIRPNYCEYRPYARYRECRQQYSQCITRDTASMNGIECMSSIPEAGRNGKVLRT